MYKNYLVSADGKRVIDPETGGWMDFARMVEVAWERHLERMGEGVEEDDAGTRATAGRVQSRKSSWSR